MQAVMLFFWIHPSVLIAIYLMRPLFDMTEAAVQSFTGIQACWDRMAQSVFCLSIFSLLLSLCLTAELRVYVHLADLHL